MRNLFLVMIMFILMAYSISVFANGGPVDWTKTTPMGGGVTLNSDTGISLEYETLSIKLQDDLNIYSVEAKYHLRNDGKGKVVQFGVPLTWPEFINREYIHFDDGEPHDSASVLKKNIKLVSRKIVLELNGKKIPCSFSAADKPYGAGQKPLHDYPYEFRELEGWCIANLKVAGSSRAVLTMKYDGELYYDDWGFSKSALTEFSDRQLSYLFYPAGFWQGNVGAVDITLDLGPYRDHVKSAVPNYTGKTDSIIEWHLKDVDFRQLKTLEVTLSPELLEKKQLLNWNRDASPYQKTVFEVKASSSLPRNKSITYTPDNVTDGAGKTAWCEGAEGGGTGEWLEFSEKTLKADDTTVPCPIEGIAIVPGYVKSQKSFLDNGRVRKVKISACSKGGPSYVFDVPLSDNSLLAPYLIKNNWVNDSKELDFIRESGCFRLEILEVEKGTFEDTCVSEVSLVLNCG